MPNMLVQRPKTFSVQTNIRLEDYYSNSSSKGIKGKNKATITNKPVTHCPTSTAPAGPPAYNAYANDHTPQPAYTDVDTPFRFGTTTTSTITPSVLSIGTPVQTAVAAKTVSHQLNGMNMDGVPVIAPPVVKPIRPKMNPAAASFKPMTQAEVIRNALRHGPSPLRQVTNADADSDSASDSDESYRDCDEDKENIYIPTAAPQIIQPPAPQMIKKVVPKFDPIQETLNMLFSGCLPELLGKNSNMWKQDFVPIKKQGIIELLRMLEKNGDDEECYIRIITKRETEPSMPVPVITITDPDGRTFVEAC